MTSPSALGDEPRRPLAIAMRREFLLVPAGAVLFSIPALLNGFPFIFPDSGDYLVFTPHLYRSPFYGLFIFFFHLNRFIWAPVFVQGLIASGLLWLMVALHVKRHNEAAFIALAILLAGFSSLPFFTGFIMADFFTPIMFVLMYIIGFHSGALPRPLLVVLLLLDCIATAAHISNLAMSMAILPLFGILLWWEGGVRRVFNRLGLLAIPVVLTAAAFLLYNASIFGTWSLSPASQTFLMANMINYGPGRTYLHEHCPQSGYKICQIGHLPKTADELLWSTGLFRKLGGFTGMEREARAIVAGTLNTRPAEVAEMVERNFASGLVTHEPAAEFRSDYQVPSINGLFSRKFGQAADSAYLASAEMRNTIPHGFIRNMDTLIVPAAFFVLLAAGAIAAWRGQKIPAALAAIMMCAVLGNTLLCTAVSGVHDRYQARVTWLLLMAAFLVIGALRQKRPEWRTRQDSNL